MFSSFAKAVVCSHCAKKKNPMSSLLNKVNLGLNYKI